MINAKNFYQAIIQLATLPLIIYGLFFENILWFGLAFAMFFIFRYIGITVVYHRMVAHGVGINDVSPVTKFILLCISFFGTITTPIQMVGIHLQHHRYTDTENDPHSPVTMGKRVLFPFLWKPKLDRAAVVACGKNKMYEFFRVHFTKLLWAMFLLLLIINYKVLIFGWLIPAGLTVWSAGYGAYISHDHDGAKDNVSWFKDIIICAGDCYKHGTHHRSRNPSDISGDGLIAHTVSFLRRF